MHYLEKQLIQPNFYFTENIHILIFSRYDIPMVRV